MIRGIFYITFHLTKMIPSFVTRYYKVLNHDLVSLKGVIINLKKNCLISLENKCSLSFSISVIFATP